MGGARLDILALGPLRLPLGPWAVDYLLGTPLAAFSALYTVGAIAPRALPLIHSRDDANPTMPLAAALAGSRRAQSQAALGRARGGHAGAIVAQPADYRRRVVGFLRRYLR